MRYEIESIKGKSILYFYADITKEEHEKLEKIDPHVILNAGKELGVTPTIYDTCIKFYKDGFGRLVTENDINAVKKDVESFLGWLREYQIPKAEPECPSHDGNDDCEATHEAEAMSVEDLEFVKKMLKDINKPKDDPSHIVGALIADTTTSKICTELTCWGQMSHNLLKAMCELYVKTYDKG